MISNKDKIVAVLNSPEKPKEKDQHMVRLYQSHTPGQNFETKDGRAYVVQQDGSYRRLDKLKTQVR